MKRRNLLVPCLFILNLFLILPVQGKTLNNRPVWLLTVSELPEGWTPDLETEVGNRYFFSFLPVSKSIFSIETIEFPNTSAASDYVIEEYTSWQQEGQLEYVFPKDKVNLSVIDTGVIWEVKSSCCYSRGVLFSTDYMYIYIFGSQTSTWEEVRIVYSTQVIKILNFLDRDIPASLYLDSKPSKSNTVDGLLFPSSLISFGIAIFYIRKRHSLK